MKKQMKRLLSVGLCLALGLSVGGGLAACGDKDNGPDTPPAADWSAGTWSVPTESYWIAGTLAGYANELENSGWGSNDGETEIPKERLFEQNSENDKLYRLVINLYTKDDHHSADEFKIRFGDMGWTGKGNLSASGNLDPTFSDKENGIYDMTGGMGGSNFGVGKDGQYEIRIDESGDKPVVTYVRKGDAPKLPVAVTGVTIEQPALVLNAGKDETLTATVKPDDADDKTVTWTTSDDKVATVDKNGKVTAVAEGEATITATIGEMTATCDVYVVGADVEIVTVESIALDKTTAKVIAGTPVTVTATILPAEAMQKVSYTSSDEKVAIVDATGKITAVAPGTATITVKAIGGKTATCEVTVPDGFYLFGKFNPDLHAAEWANLTGKLNEVPASIVFEQDEENADKYTLEATFYRGDQIKILPMSGPDETWSNAIGMGQIVDSNNKFSDGGGGNIKFLDSAEYKFTLEKVADTSEDAEEGAKKWQLSYEILSDIADTTYESYKVTVYGTGNGWASEYTGKTVNAVTAADEWTVEITLELAADEVFQFRQVYGDPEKTNYIGAGQGVNGSNASGDLFDNESSNYKCKTAGTYKFTIVFNEYGECESVTAVAA